MVYFTIQEGIDDQFDSGRYRKHYRLKGGRAGQRTIIVKIFLNWKIAVYFISLQD
jgi:hypothetical protein